MAFQTVAICGPIPFRTAMTQRVVNKFTTYGLPSIVIQHNAPWSIETIKNDRMAEVKLYYTGTISIDHCVLLIPDYDALTEEDHHVLTYLLGFHIRFFMNVILCTSSVNNIRVAHRDSVDQVISIGHVELGNTFCLDQTQRRFLKKLQSDEIWWLDNKTEQVYPGGTLPYPRARNSLLNMGLVIGLWGTLMIRQLLA